MQCFVFFQHCFQDQKVSQKAANVAAVPSLWLLSQHGHRQTLGPKRKSMNHQGSLFQSQLYNQFLFETCRLLINKIYLNILHVFHRSCARHLCLRSGRSFAPMRPSQKPCVRALQFLATTSLRPWTASQATITGGCCQRISCSKRHRLTNEHDTINLSPFTLTFFTNSS